jgi:hypothetical protein
MSGVLHSNGASLFIILQLDPFKRDITALEKIANGVSRGRSVSTVNFHSNSIVLLRFERHVLAIGLGRPLFRWSNLFCADLPRSCS